MTVDRNPDLLDLRTPLTGESVSLSSMIMAIAIKISTTAAAMRPVLLIRWIKHIRN
jgi:hypothetical protein